MLTLFLEAMQNENSLFELYGVDSTIRSVGIVFDHLKYASAAKALKHLRRVMLTTSLRKIQCVTKELPHLGGKRH